MNKKIISAVVVVAAIVAVFLLFPKGQHPAKVESQTAAPAINVKAAKDLYAQAVKLRQMNEPLKARAIYQDIVKNYPDIDNMAAIQQEAEALNMQILFSRTEVPEKTVIHEVMPGDSLAKIAKKYNTTTDFIRRSNNLKGDVVRLGERLRIWVGKFNVFVDKSQNILIQGRQRSR